MSAAFEAGWADPRRLYAEARRARRMLDQAREVIAAGLGVQPPEVSFHPGGPAALRTGLDGLRYAGRRRGTSIVASAVEHSAVLLEVAHLVATDVMAGPGTVPVDRSARVDLDAWAQAVDGPVAAAALQSANGEVGTRQPTGPAHEICSARGIPLLVDATAGLGRDPVPAAYDVLAGDARSWGGPPGVGVLVVPARTRWRVPGPVPEAEAGRSPVEPVVPLVLAAAEAWQQTEHSGRADAREAHELVARIRAAAARLPDTEVAGDPDDRLPHVTTFSCLFVDGEALVHELDGRGFAVASGSACTSSTLEPSHVLAAMGVLTHGNVRVTLPLASTVPDRAESVDRFCTELPNAVAAVRARLDR
jgi:cysteine desulfurase